MDTKVPGTLITTNQTVLCTAMFNGPRLTPTGKISHAKTRVYTQRYRKEWEQMPDFKGWLTSVPCQDTRAFCTYCNKNLHAHRLSLLKHTCTMKHQRAALMHQNEMNAKQAVAASSAAACYGTTTCFGDTKIETSYEEGDVEQVHLNQRESDPDGEDDNVEYEYVVERLEMEDDELDSSRGNRDEQDDAGQNAEYEEEDESLNVHCSSEEDDPISINKRIKIERVDDNSEDALAKAMAHVHGEYLDGTDEQVNVELEMVVTSEDGAMHEADQDASENTLEEDGGESQNNDQEDAKQCGSDDKFLTEGYSSEIGSESEISSPERLRQLSDTYVTMNNKCLNPAYASAIPSSSGQSKTFKLSSGKTVTLRPGTQYVLSNVKGTNIPTIVMADRRNLTQSGNSTNSEQAVNNGSQKINPYAAVPGTSQQLSGQKSAVKASPGTKKPCISTHVMDTSKGLPVGGLQVSLYKLMDGRWTFLNESNTSPSGHCNDLVLNSKSSFTAGRYKMHFDVDKYFTLRRIETMYPFIEIVFDVKNPTGNYHIPVLLSPFGYTTYRGSDR